MHLLDDVELELENTRFPPERLEESNIVLINGVPVEKIFSPDITFAGCSSCPDPSGEQDHCLGVPPGRDFFKAIPSEILRGAILKVLKRD
jgi:hypothetical protein